MRFAAFECAGGSSLPVVSATSPGLSVVLRSYAAPKTLRA